VRLWQALRGKVKQGSAVRDLGCSIEYFKLWIFMMFQPGMTWENYGKVWHIDHIKPLAAFDLTDREQFLQAVNYKNLQPLRIEENGSKGSLYNGTRYKFRSVKLQPGEMTQ